MLLGECQAFPCPHEEEVALPQVAGNQGHNIKRLDARGHSDVGWRFPQGSLDPEHGLAETAAHVPEMAEIACQAEQMFLPLVGLRPLQGCSEVFGIPCQAIHPQALPVPE